ncbi:inosine/xanthosine triphosphatase [Patescibacteria group bacterium]
MKKLVITSKNPVKIEATLRGFRKVFPNEDFEVETVSVDSGVSVQPMTDKETYDGALNRVINAEKKYKKDYFFVGLEGGIDVINGGVFMFGWVVVKSNERIGKGRTTSTELPKKVYKQLMRGKELGDVMDELFHRRNLKQKEGALGVVTRGAIKRVDIFTDAVVTALVPFINRKLY